MIARLTILISLVCCAFSSDKTPEKRYRSFKRWYQQHHQELLFRQSQNGLTFELNYLPGEVTIFQQIFQSGSVTRKQLKSLYEQYGAYEQYSFRIEAPGVSDLLIATSLDKTEYRDRQFYLIESVQQDFYMVQGTDTLRPLRCNFENNYGAAPFITLHLAFEKIPDKKIRKCYMYYTDRLFGADTVSFDLSSLTNLRIPKIK